MRSKVCVCVGGSVIFSPLEEEEEERKRVKNK
jgi:hypothetical protein